jgi:hypothetical protein
LGSPLILHSVVSPIFTESGSERKNMVVVLPLVAGHPARRGWSFGSSFPCRWDGYCGGSR